MNRATSRLATLPRGVISAPLGWVWLFVVAGLAAVSVLDLGGDVAAWILFLACLSSSIVARELREDRALRAVFAVAITAHIAVAVIDNYLGVTLGASADALGFHLSGENIAQLGELASPTLDEPYSRWLSWVYRAFGPSLLLGNAVSVVASTVAYLTALKVLRLLGVTRRASICALFALLPSGLMFLSVTLRESYQLLFYVLATYAALRARERGVAWWIVLFAACAALAIFHNGLAMYAGFLLVSAVVWSAARSRAAATRVLPLVLALGVVALAATRLQGVTQSIDALSKGKAFEYAETYRRGGAAVEARTTYGLTLDSSSPLNFAATVPVVFAEYMVAPMPWQIGGALDVYASLEALFRVVLLVVGIRAWRRASGERRSQLGFLLYTYVSLELLWSLGTVNWGTASRHHQPGMVLLICFGGPGLLEGIRRLRLRRAPRTV